MNLKMKHNIFFISVFLLFVQVLRAQDTLQLKHAIELVLENHYGIKIVKNNELIAERNNTITNAGLLPTITAEGNQNNNYYNTYQGYHDDRPPREVEAARTSALTARIMVNWTVFDGITMFATKQRLSQLEKIGKLQTQQEILDILLQTVSAYYNIVQQEKILKAIGNALEISNERVRLANTRLQIGSGSELNLLQAQLDRNTDSSEYVRQMIFIKNIKAELNRLMVRDDSSDFIVSNDIPINGALDYSELYSKVLEQNPGLLEAQMNVNIAQINKKLARAAYFPRINLFAGYNYSNTTSEAGFFAENRQTGPLYGVSATFTIFNGFQARRNAGNANIQYQSSQYALEQSGLLLKNEFWKLYNEYVLQLKLVKLETENAIAAQKSTELSFQIYKQGMMSDIDFRTAQQKQLDADIRLLSAQYIAKLKETQLLSLSGELMK